MTLSDSTGLPIVEMRLARNCKVLRSRQILRHDGKVSKITDLDPIFCQMTRQRYRIRFIISLLKPQTATQRILALRLSILASIIRCRLSNYIAVASEGHLIGYDFWDDDKWPDDSDPRGNVFFPMHHGSTVSSVLSRESGDSTISIYRFPAEQMCRFSTLLTHIAKTLSA